MPTVQGFTATIPEMKVASILDKKGINYEFQRSFMGGRESAGGSISDFYLPYLSLIISVLGIYWHISPTNRARDSLQRESLSGFGITTIYITDEQISRNATFYVEEALELRDHSGWGALL